MVSVSLKSTSERLVSCGSVSFLFDVTTSISVPVSCNVCCTACCCCTSNSKICLSNIDVSSNDSDDTLFEAIVDLAIALSAILKNM